MEINQGYTTMLSQPIIKNGPIQLLYFPSFTWHGSRIRNFTHTFLSNILTIFYSSSALQHAWHFCAGSCPTYLSDPFWQ
jgi:hypothetical protein